MPAKTKIRVDVDAETINFLVAAAAAFYADAQRGHRVASLGPACLQSDSWEIVETRRALYNQVTEWQERLAGKRAKA